MDINLLLGQLLAMHPYQLSIDVDMHRRDKSPINHYLDTSPIPPREMGQILQTGHYVMVSVKWLKDDTQWCEETVWGTTMSQALFAMVNQLASLGVSLDKYILTEAAGLINSVLPKCKRGFSLRTWDFSEVGTEHRFPVIQEYVGNGDLRDIKMVDQVIMANCLVDIDFGVVGTRNKGVVIHFDMNQALTA